ncbi:MAG: ABC transporter permease [Eubacterium sp.]
MDKMSLTQQEFLRAYKRHKLSVNFFRVFILLIFFGAWEICSHYGIINSFIFSSPSRIVKSFISLTNDGEIFVHIGVTVSETLICFALVMILGIILAVILWRSKKLSDILEPYLVVLNSLPKTALAPVLIVWLGNNIKTIIVAAVSVCVFGTIISIYSGFQNVETEKIKLIYTLGGTQNDALKKVIVPSTVPTIISAMKVNIGLSLVGVIIGEFLAATKGLGYLIIYGSQVFKLDWVLLSIMILCILAIILYGAINLLEKKCVGNW